MTIKQIVKLLSILQDIEDYGYRIIHCDEEIIIFEKDSAFGYHSIGIDFLGHCVWQFGKRHKKTLAVFDELVELLRPLIKEANGTITTAYLGKNKKNKPHITLKTICSPNYKPSMKKEEGVKV